MDTKEAPAKASTPKPCNRIRKVSEFFSQTIEVDAITFALFIIWVFTLIVAIL